MKKLKRRRKKRKPYGDPVQRLSVAHASLKSMSAYAGRMVKKTLELQSRIDRQQLTIAALIRQIESLTGNGGGATPGEKAAG